MSNTTIKSDWVVPNIFRVYNKKNGLYFNPGKGLWNKTGRDYDSHCNANLGLCAASKWNVSKDDLEIREFSLSYLE